MICKGMFKADKEVEEEFYLQLQSPNPNVVQLVAVNGQGERISGGILLSVDIHYGTIRRHSYVNPKLGFSLNEEKAVVIKE